MPETTLAIRPGDIRCVEIECRHCGCPAVLPLDAPRSGAGHYASRRCLWCAADFPRGYHEAVEGLLSALRILSREAPMQVRMMMSQADPGWRSRPSVPPLGGRQWPLADFEIDQGSTKVRQD
jgi:hypothetical protein